MRRPCSRIVLACVAALVPSLRLPAQEADDLPTERVQIIPPGGLVDLDSGAVLPVAKLRVFTADLRFDRDGAGFFLQPLHGAQKAGPTSVAPEEDAWTAERIRIPRHETNAIVLFVRTDRGVARVALAVPDPYSTASAVLRWAVVPPKAPLFLPPPTALESQWQDGRLVVRWAREGTRWLVEVHGERTDKHTVDEPTLTLADLDPKGRYRIRVRSMQGGAVSLPADVVQHGVRQPARRATIEFPGPWYDRSGGLRLSTAAESIEDAEVVFYLYGVYVPGGGVLKLGQGERVFRATHELPAGPYPPTYGRLDEHDVLAVELPDGRCGKLWLEPMRGDDLRDGMRVHSVFLPDGRRALQAPPLEVAAATEDGVVVARWKAPPAAASYRVELSGQPPVTTKETTVRWPGLARDRMFVVVVTALAEDGDASEPVPISVHTFGPDARLGTATLEAQNGGVVLSTGAAVADGQPCDLALVGGAGGSASLTFAAKGGIASGRDHTFGDFGGAGGPTEQTQLQSDVREPQSEHFYVHTADGGLASVRIVQRGWPRTKVEFVWRPAKR